MSLTEDTTRGPIKFASVSATADGDNTLVAAVTGKKIRVISYAIVGDAAGEIIFKSGASTTVGAFELSANSGVSFVGGPSAPAFETASGTALVLNNGTGVDVKGHIAYIEV